MSITSNYQPIFTTGECFRGRFINLCPEALHGKVSSKFAVPLNPPIDRRFPYKIYLSVETLSGKVSPKCVIEAFGKSFTKETLQSKV
jgi:hypothetical protein